MSIKQSSLSLLSILMFIGVCGIPHHTALADVRIREISGAPYSSLKILELTNKARTAQRLNPLTLNLALSNAAQLKAIDMAMNGYFAHVAPTGTKYWDFISGAGYAFKTAGENLAFQYKSTDALVKAWLTSSSHRANILGTQYTDVGIGMAYTERNGQKGWYVVEMFGSTHYSKIFSLK